MEGSIKENPSKFTRQSVFRIDSYSRNSFLFFFFFIWKSFSRIEYNANSFDTFEEELLKERQQGTYFFELNEIEIIPLATNLVQLRCLTTYTLLRKL